MPILADILFACDFQRKHEKYVKFFLIPLVFGGVIREVEVKSNKYLHFTRSKMSLIAELYH